MKTPTNPFTFGNAMRVSLAACALIMPSVSAMAEKIHVSTPSTSLVLDGEKGVTSSSFIMEQLSILLKSTRSAMRE